MQGASGQQSPQGSQGQRGPADPHDAQGAGNTADRQQRQQFLDSLPPDFAGQVKALNQYAFFSPEAQQAFDELMDMLKQQAMGNMFRDMAQSLANMTSEDLQRLKEMLADLNQMMDQQVWVKSRTSMALCRNMAICLAPIRPESGGVGARACLPDGSDAITVQQPAGRPPTRTPGDDRVGL